MGSLTQALIGLTGFVLSASGLVKTIAVKSELTAFMAKEFHGYAKVFPLAAFGYIPDPDLYRTSVGSIEAILGALLIFGSSRGQTLGALGLLFMMIGATHTNLVLGLHSQACISVSFAAIMTWFLFQSKGHEKDTKKD